MSSPAWRRVGVTLVLAVSAACTTSEPRPQGAPGGGAHLRPAGTALADGVEVPSGAWLAGAVVTFPPAVFDVPGPLPDAWMALLVVDEPLAAWDALAAQVRDLGPAMPGSRDACAWAQEAEVDDPADLTPVAETPPDRIDHIRCDAEATDGDLDLHLRLRAGGDHPGTIHVLGSSGTAPAPRAFVRRAGAIDLETPVGPARAEAAVAEAVPAVDPRPEPSVGDGFGGTVGCIGHGPGRMALPEGAELVATEGGPGGTSVLATPDAESTLGALATSAARNDPAFEVLPVEDERADGSVPLAATFVHRDGGRCGLRASMDERFLMIVPRPG